MWLNLNHYTVLLYRYQRLVAYPDEIRQTIMIGATPEMSQISIDCCAAGAAAALLLVAANAGSATFTAGVGS